MGKKAGTSAKAQFQKGQCGASVHCLVDHGTGQLMDLALSQCAKNHKSAKMPIQRSQNALGPRSHASASALEMGLETFHNWRWLIKFTFLLNSSLGTMFLAGVGIVKNLHRFGHL